MILPRMLLLLLAGAWSLPVIGLRRAGFPSWFFICLGLFWLFIFTQAEPLYDWGVAVRRRLGMRRLADYAERMKLQLLPPARLALLIMAAISFAGVLL